MSLKTVFLLLTLLLVACAAPSQHDEAHYGTITVAFGPSLDGVWDWSLDQRTQLRAELVALNALGPTFTEAPEGSAQLVVRDWSSGPHCERGAGRFTPGTSYVEIDPTCVGGSLELRAAMGHELGHALGLTHVCIEAGEVTICSPVGIGPAVMNPSLSYGDVLDATMSSRYTGIGTDVPTDLDLAEWRRTH